MGIHRAVRYRTMKSTVPVSAVDANLPPNAAMLAAKAPLASRTAYNVRMSGYVQAAKAARGSSSGSRPGSGGRSGWAAAR